MGLFRYEVVDKSGKVLHGSMDAADDRQVADKLTSMGYCVRAVYSAKQSAVHQPSSKCQPSQTATPTAAPAAKVPVCVRSVVPPMQLAIFFRQLSTLVKSGIPLHQSFVDMSAFTRERHLAAAMPHMQAAVQSGQKISGAMAAYPGVFPVWTTASVWAGELAGKLDIVLEEIAVELEKESSDYRYGAFWWFITKLTIVSCVIIFPLCNISNWLTKSNITIPEMIANVSSVTLKMTPLAVAVAAIFVGWTSIKRVPSVRVLLDAILLHVPIWGKLHKDRALAKFLHILDLLYSAGISPATAWDAASLTVKNNEIARKLNRARVHQPGAERAADLLQLSGVFEVDDVGIAQVGEKSGRLPEALGQMANVYFERADHQRSIGRAVSVSSFITSQIIVSGIATIIIAYTYFYKLPKVFGLDF